MPKPGDRRVDEAGPASADGLPVQAEPLEPAGLEVLHEHVRPVQNGVRGLPVLGVGEVEGDGLLVAVHREVVGADPVPLGGHPEPRVVAVRGLHLDDGGAHVGQEHGGVGTREDAGEVRDDDAVQGTPVGLALRDLDVHAACSSL